MGNLIKVNNVDPGNITSGNIVSLHSKFAGGGGVIGSARAYSFNLEDAPYTNDATRWELRLFDIQTNTDLVLNQAVSNTEVPAGSFIKGKNSGASGFSISAGGGSVVVPINQTSGTFSEGEQIQVNGIDISRTVGVATAHTVQDIKSVKEGTTFQADTVLERFKLPNNIETVNITNGGVVTAGSKLFTGLKKGDIVRYFKTTGSAAEETFNEVSNVSADGKTLTVVAISPNVTGVFNGALPSSTITVSMFLGAPLISGRGSLYSQLSNDNVATVDLTRSKLKVSRKLTKNSSSGVLTVDMSSDFGFAASEAIFETFDQERYTLLDNNNAPIAITKDKFTYANNGEAIEINSGGANLSKTIDVTIIKNKIKSKLKEYKRSQVLNVTRSKYAKSGSVNVGLGASTIADGLIFDQRYGLRVQDETISLNYPDAVQVLAIYESINTDAPKLDVLQFTSTADVTTNAIIGENIIGENSKIVARVVGKPNTNKLSIIYQTPDKFNVGESVIFSESNIKTNVQSVEIGVFKDITNSYTLDKGQRDQFYDYSRIIRNKNTPEPKGPLLIVFDYYSVASNDTGDVFTVFSYDEERYTDDIPLIGDREVRATDTFDFRPRVSVYDPSSDTGSPFEFKHRDFSGTSVIEYVKPDETVSATYEYYLPRVDRVYLNKFGDFVYEKGISSLDPKPPVKNDEVMQLGTIELPPYLYNTQNASLTLDDNRRFTMRDIGDIEDRVSNLEETTTLSLLEVNAQSLQIQDEEGKNRFKSGFFADAFRDYSFINRNLSSVQVNPESQELISFRTRDTLASQVTPKESTISTELDFNTDFELFDPNVKKTGNVVTLNYEEIEWITQPYATKTGDVNDIINVNPYELPVFEGNVELDPTEDIWTRTVRLPDQVIRQTGTNTVQNITAGTTNRSVTVSNVDRTIQNSLVSSSSDDFMRSRNIQFISGGFLDYVEVYLFLDGQKIFDIIPKLLEITPSVNGTEYGSNGSFKIGETVNVYPSSSSNVSMVFRVCQPDHKSGAFNNPTEVYLNDPYSSGVNPIPNDYSQSSAILNVDTKALSEEAQGNFYGYLSKNSLLVGQESGATAYVKDLRLITDAFGDLIGSCFLRDPHTKPSPVVKIQSGRKNLKLTTSPTNEIVDSTEKFGVLTAETNYSAFGTVEEWQNTITVTTDTTTINFRAEPRPPVTTRRRGNSRTRRNNRNRARRARRRDPLAQTFLVGGNVKAPSAAEANKDFNGVFITSVEVYFATVDTVSNTPIVCEVRTTTGDARPSMILAGRSKTLRPKGVDANGNEITLIESDPDAASKPTKFTFPEPIYLAPGNTYSFVLVAPNSTAYNVWTARHGGRAVNASSIQSADSGASLIYSTQYGAGALFKSQNGSLWTEDQTQDMTFKLYKAKFTSLSGSAYFNNPDLNDSNGYMPVLNDNPIQVLPKTGSIGITTTLNNGVADILSPGRKICGSRETSTAVVVGTGCSVNAVGITTAGTNYATDTNVSTFNITGEGSGLTLNVQASGGALVSAVPVANGTGYKVGDVVGIVTSTVGVQGGEGENARITITETLGIDTLYLTDIQSDDTSYTADNTVPLKYFNDSNTVVSFGSTALITRRNFNTSGVNAGNVFKVNHFNHGMYSTTNKVKIKGIESDVAPTTLTAVLSKTETNTIGIGSTTPFTNFEGIPVSATNIGYVQIGDEIIGYQSVGSGVLNIASGTGNQRGVDNTVPIEHQIDAVVKKYEFGGVSMRRIQVPDTSTLGLSSPIDLDSYHVTFDRTANGKNRSADSATEPQLSFNSEAFVGGSNVRASENILYSALVPRYDVLTPTGVTGARTNVSASIRTVTGTSVGGNEVPFIDEGFQNVQLNTYNSLDTVQMVTSKINETQYLQGLPNGKSFSTILNLSSNDENISPIITLSSGSETEFISNRLNNPIGEDRYSEDNRVNSIVDDPHASIYVSNTVFLNKPATSLKVILSACRPESSDFRVLYSLIKADSSEVEQSFNLFPGFNNTTQVDGDGFVVDDQSKNDGRSDTFVPISRSDEFREYQFTVDNLDEFTGFTIKLVMLGTNQAQPPRIKELRAIAVK